MRSRGYRCLAAATAASAIAVAFPLAAAAPASPARAAAYRSCSVKTNPDFAMGRQGWLKVSNDTCAHGRSVSHAYIARYRRNTRFVVRRVLGYGCKAAYASDEFLLVRCSKSTRRIQFVYRAFS